MISPGLHVIVRKCWRPVNFKQSPKRRAHPRRRGLAPQPGAADTDGDEEGEKEASCLR